MKFTIANEDGILCYPFFDSYIKAKEYFKTDQIIPVVGLKEWKEMPDEYKGFKNKKPYCLYLTDKGTVYGEVWIVYSI